MTTFRSVRLALSYAYSHRKGPRLAQQRLGRSPSEYRSPWDACAVRACACLAGALPNTEAERELTQWLFRGGPKPSKLVKRIRTEMVKEGLVIDEPEVVYDPEMMVHVEWEDPTTGQTVRTRGVE